MEVKTFKQQLLDDLYAPFKNCMRCPLGGLGRTQVVFGSGNPDARLMLIGEGPGADEDKQGLPFVGRSGQLLTRLLTAAGTSRDQVYISNIVKCRPPGNRKPLPLESSTCKKLLLFKQIKIIRPTILCTLGSTALEGLLSQQVKITQARGKEIKFEDMTIIPTYHPAYILRNPKELETLFADLSLAIRLATHAHDKGGG
jgi:uracil-DNA glycosylase